MRIENSFVNWLAAVVLLVATTIAIGIAGCRPAPGSSASNGTRSIVRVAYAPVVLNAPLFVAMDKGWFPEASIDLEATPFTTANDMITALATSRVDAVTGVSIVPVLNLEAQSPGRVRVLLHSRMTNDAPYDSIVALPKSGVGSLSDLTGKRIAVYPGTTATNLLTAFLRRRGYDPAKIQIIPIPPGSIISALSSGSVEAALAYEPTLTVALEQGAAKIFGSIYVDMLEPSPIAVSVAARAFERSHRDALGRFVGVLDRAIADIRRDPAGARASVAKHTNLAASTAERVGLVPDVLSTEVDAANVQALVTLLADIGEVPRTVSAAPLLEKSR